MDRVSDCTRGINGSIRQIGNQVLPLIENTEPKFIDEYITCFVSVEKTRINYSLQIKNKTPA